MKRLEKNGRLAITSSVLVDNIVRSVKRTENKQKIAGEIQNGLLESSY